jgi:phosphoenolpyruvate---glycerone phosphotransferase subunit DhaL
LGNELILVRLTGQYQFAFAGLLFLLGATMQFTPALIPELIQAIAGTIEKNAEAVTSLDQILGDGDHVINLQRGIDALQAQSSEFVTLEWDVAWQKIGMTLMSTMGGASGSLFGTLFVSMSKAAKGQSIDIQVFSDVFSQGVQAVKQRGKADAGEKTMLDVLVPVAETLRQAASENTALPVILDKISAAAITGMESTRNMLATKGRASFQGERSRGHIDAGAKTSQLIICAIVDVLAERSATPP